MRADWVTIREVLETTARVRCKGMTVLDTGPAFRLQCPGREPVFLDGGELSTYAKRSNEALVGLLEAYVARAEADPALTLAELVGLA